MSTPEIAVQTIAADSAEYQAGLRRRSRWNFVFRHMWLQVLVDYLSVVAGLWAGRELFHLCVPVEASKATMGSALSILLVAVSAMLVFTHIGVYSRRATPLNIAETEMLIRGVAYMTLLAMIVSLSYMRWPALEIGLSGAVVTLLLLSARPMVRVLIRAAHDKGYGIRRVIVYRGACVSRAERDLPYDSHPGLAYVGVVVEPECKPKAAGDSNLNPTSNSTADSTPGIAAPSAAIARLAKELAATDLLVEAPCISPVRLAEVVRACEQLDLRLSIVTSPLGPSNRWDPDELSSGLPIASYRQNDSSLDGAIRRAVDLVVASSLMVILAPIFLVVAVFVRIDSRGPIFFRHRRIGKGGHAFFLWKFRTMREDVPKYQRSPTSDSDIRLTRVGRVLRRISVDELPQLFNVLRGDMSLVGPRPEMPFVVARYGPLERQRLRVKPGITGLWQISPARAAPIHENIEYDLFYVDRQNVFLDCAILLRTVAAVIRGVGAA